MPVLELDKVLNWDSTTSLEKPSGFWSVVCSRRNQSFYVNFWFSSFSQINTLCHEWKTAKLKVLLLPTLFILKFIFDSLFDLFQFIWFCLRFVFVHSIICSINWFVFVTLLYPIKLDFVCWLLYTCCTLYSLPGSTVHLPHDFLFYHVLIVLPVEVAIDTPFDKTTSMHISREQSFWRQLRWELYREFNRSIACCFVCIVSISDSKFKDLTLGRGANMDR